MKKPIKLNSSEWCDLIFENKNKEYGAYKLRQSSSKWHIVSFLIVVALVVFIAFLPSIISTVKASNGGYLGGVDEPRIMSKITEEKVVEVIIPRDPIPEPPKLKESIKFVPPAIVADNEVTKENEMVDQEKLIKSTGVIARFTVDKADASANGIHPDELDNFKRIVDVAPTESGPISFAEVMPAFPGGERDMQEFIARHLRYPVDAQESAISGRVTVRFVVTKEGKIDNVQILKGIHPSCDKEAIRVVKMMPKWIAGMQNGNPVAVYFTLPIVYRLK